MSGTKPASAFVAVEGGEGAGKSGVILALADALRARGLSPLVTREPGGTPEGEDLRALLLRSTGPHWEREAELLLVTAARIQHAKHVILPGLKAGRIVISDRFVGSTLAYQGAGHGVDREKIVDLHNNFVGSLWPDLTIVLDVDPMIGIQRSRGRLTEAGSDESRFEDLDLSFHARVRNSFLQQAADHPDRHVVIDAHQPAGVVKGQAIEQLLTRLRSIRTI